MDWLTRIKMGLFFAALIFFTNSMLTGNDWPRWVAVGLLVVAFLIRFVPRGPRQPPNSSSSA